LNHKITISGGGLAGLSLATALLRRHIPVEVLEAGDYPRHRVCGEFISGVSTETLDFLGIADLFDDAHRHHTLSWHDQGQKVHENRFKDPALGISRFRLDERLCKRVQALGGIVNVHTRAIPKPQEGSVWTAGRRPKNGNWIGLKAHIRVPNKSTDLEMHTGTNGYAGLAGVEDGWTNVCGLFQLDRSIKASGERLLTAYLEAGGNSQLATTLDQSEWRAGSFSSVAGFELGRQAALPGLLALGDAESMIPPFTGNGMSMAFQAAECAVEPLCEFSNGERSWQDTANKIRAALRRKFRRRLTMALTMHPFLLSPSGRSLIQCFAFTQQVPFQPLLSLIR
jgi:flavin-dependent dehydrogenase